MVTLPCRMDDGAANTFRPWGHSVVDYSLGGHLPEARASNLDACKSIRC